MTRNSHLKQFFAGKNLTVAVVGNGPISEDDRVQIASKSVDHIVRFNDVNNWRTGERTTLHAVRHPSYINLFRHVSAPVWHIGSTRKLIPENADIVSWAYEPQHHSTNVLPDTARVFPNCDCGPSCLQSSTWAGCSTGAIVLSELQNMASVGRIDVYGMNWNGDATMHCDFANTSIVSSCCTLCNIHATSSNSYGGQAAVIVLIVFFGSIIGAVCCFGEGLWMLCHRKKPQEANLPLLALPPPKK